LARYLLSLAADLQTCFREALFCREALFNSTAMTTTKLSSYRIKIPSLHSRNLGPANQTLFSTLLSLTSFQDIPFPRPQIQLSLSTPIVRPPSMSLQHSPSQPPGSTNSHRPEIHALFMHIYLHMEQAEILLHMSSREPLRSSRSEPDLHAGSITLYIAAWSFPVRPWVLSVPLSSLFRLLIMKPWKAQSKSKIPVFSTEYQWFRSKFPPVSAYEYITVIPALTSPSLYLSHSTTNPPRAA